MKSIIKILSFLMLLFLLTAEDCGNSRTETIAVESSVDPFTKIEKNFTVNELSDEALQAFEKSAEQKLIDLNDFINIYANIKYSREFRIQAAQMIQELFTNDSGLKLYYKNLGIIEDSENSILLNAEDNSMFKAEVNSITIEKAFHKISVWEYSGEILFSQQIKNISSNSLEDIKIPIQMRALKSTSNFGNETLEVWKVFFEL